MRYLQLILAMTALAVPAASDVVWDFSSGAQGWRLTDHACSSSYITIIQAYPVTWVASGGNPGGYIEGIDPENNCFFFDAPAASLGDWSQYIGGTLEYAMKSSVRNWTSDNAIAIIGTNGVSLIGKVEPVPYPQWGAYALQLVPSKLRKNAINGPAATDSEIAAVLGSLAAFRISGEYGAQAHQERVGLDSVRVRRKQVLGIRGWHTGAPTAAESAKRYWFRVWGWTSQVSAGSFLVDDGSGRQVRVEAAGHGVTSGMFVTAVGLLDPGSSPPVLSSSQWLVSMQ